MQQRQFGKKLGKGSIICRLHDFHTSRTKFHPKSWKLCVFFLLFCFFCSYVSSGIPNCLKRMPTIAPLCHKMPQSESQNKRRSKLSMFIDESYFCHSQLCSWRCFYRYFVFSRVFKTNDHFRQLLHRRQHENYLVKQHQKTRHGHNCETNGNCTKNIDVLFQRIHDYHECSS